MSAFKISVKYRLWNTDAEYVTLSSGTLKLIDSANIHCCRYSCHSTYFSLAIWASVYRQRLRTLLIPLPQNLQHLESWARIFKSKVVVLDLIKKSLCLEFLNQGLAVSQSLEFTILYPHFFVKKKTFEIILERRIGRARSCVFSFIINFFANVKFRRKKA